MCLLEIITLSPVVLSRDQIDPAIYEAPPDGADHNQGADGAVLIHSVRGAALYGLPVMSGNLRGREGGDR
jgi:hypothetical protein